jgi:hypothetical protein
MSYGMPTFVPAWEIRVRYRVHPETDDHRPMVPGVVDSTDVQGDRVVLSLTDGRVLELGRTTQVFTAIWDR